MADIVNLRMIRKQKARAQKDAAAEENRRLHGRSRAEKHAIEMEAAHENRHLDGHHLKPAQSGTPDAD